MIISFFENLFKIGVCNSATDLVERSSRVSSVLAEFL